MCICTVLIPGFFLKLISAFTHIILVTNSVETENRLISAKCLLHCVKCYTSNCLLHTHNNCIICLLHNSKFEKLDLMQSLATESNWMFSNIFRILLQSLYSTLSIKSIEDKFQTDINYQMPVWLIVFTVSSPLVTWVVNEFVKHQEIQ